MGCKLRWIDRELLENHSPTFWRFLKELRIVLHIKEMYFIKQKCSEHYALFLRVTLDLYQITVIAETCSMRWCDRVGSNRETFLCLRGALILTPRKSAGHWKTKNKSVFFTILFFPACVTSVVSCTVHIAILHPDRMWTSAGSLWKMISFRGLDVSPLRMTAFQLRVAGFKLVLFSRRLLCYCNRSSQCMKTRYLKYWCVKPLSHLLAE